MEHVVFFPGPDGQPSFRRLASLDEAVRYVEHLRNIEGVSEVSVHSLAPVPLSFRPYYKVEVPAGEMVVEAPAEPVAPVEIAPVEIAPVEVTAAEVAPAEVAPAEVAPAEVAAMVPAPAEPVGEQLPAEQVAELAPEPSANGRRSLGFFTH